MFIAIKKVNMRITNIFTGVDTLILLLKKHQPFSQYLKYVLIYINIMP